MSASVLASVNLSTPRCRSIFRRCPIKLPYRSKEVSREGREKFTSDFVKELIYNSYSAI